MAIGVALTVNCPEDGCMPVINLSTHITGAVRGDVMTWGLISWATGIVAALLSHERTAWVRGGFTGRYVAGVRNQCSPRAHKCPARPGPGP